MSNSPIMHPAAERIVWSHGRLVVLCAMAAGWLLVAVGRLYWLQVEEHDHFLGKALEQQREVLTLDAPRGTIYDARGRELAVSIEALSVVADPAYLKRLAKPREQDTEGGDDATQPLDIDQLARQLAGVLGQSWADVRAKLDSDKRFVWIERKVDRPVAERVAALGLPGIQLLPESKRYYPMGTLAASIIGYVGTDNQGLAGLEAHYDAAVRTEKGRTTVLRDGRAGTLVYPGLGRSEARPGRDLHLTIDSVLQNIVERELAAGLESSNARAAQAVMLDPSTGAVLAMASLPSFDPNRWNAYPEKTWRNAPVQDAYEPGSTFKMVTLAAALESGHVDPLLPVNCGNGAFHYGKTTINDHKSFGELTVREIIAKSSNVGAIHLGRFAGDNLLYGTIRRFGFGEPTGIDLPGESAGQLRSVDRWSTTDPFYISFGQGVGVTALQLTNAFAAIANDGRRLRPFVVRAVGDRDVSRQEVQGLVAAPSTVRQVKTILEQVVLDGTAKAAALDSYRSAGKTGTAQKALPGRGYVDGRYVASFVGFAPMEKPEVVLLVLLDEPYPRYHGGDVAAPIFHNIVQETLLYLGEQAPQRSRPLAETLPHWPEGTVAPETHAEIHAETHPDNAAASATGGVG